MIEKIIDFSVKNRLIIGLLTLAMVAWGVYNFTILPIDAVPDITNNQVQVITVSASLAPQEVEQFITFPIEMAMANIQDVTEIRSISRSGLSVVTIVFKDKVSPYLARQLVSEQIKIAENDIPEGYGKPEMMPITTGLGEIYQYVIEPEPGYENVYDAMTIRTIQDWIIKRYLSGIPGIVEISSFGGFLKQYEVSIQPRTLVAMDITILEIFEALEKNNQNSGGSYIEKGPGAYYIRAEGMIEQEKDIENIVVKNINGIPILIKDVADVQISSPPRYGAMTKDGKGEAVGGITLMLKGANTAKVIKEVKTRMEEVKKTLPDGLKVHAYLDRARLIKKTINTVSKNLIEGGLIVIFVLVLLLGNYRAGLIVASVIPLSMLFAFSMMNMFGVTANLMSLGAIDFGLIVDGSVIVVEGIMHQLHRNTGLKRLTQQQLDSEILVAGKKVSRSAVFGVLIILIVYLPILAFTGIEGKTFRPMAQTVSFALLGALILSLTYVPMISSLTLSKKLVTKKTFSDKIVEFLQRSHEPVLKFALKYRMMMMGTALVIVIISFYAFSKMGGEFIPTLEEGDLAAQMTLSPGSSLTESIASSTKAEKILLDNFPEVVEVVSKIGTAEVPTDPMAIEDADIMIILKEKEEWTSAKTREELVDKMKEKLAVLPGLSFEFQQPIQLRFNELMTGVKSDVAVKIYGEDLNQLFDKANEAAAIIQKVEGAGDVKVEQIVGLPQLVVKYKRDKLAQYGLNINDINRVIKSAYAGESAGVIFEGEKRFDLVVRLCEECRSEFRSIQNLRINPPTGELITLSQVADISIQQGPMQISRDNTKRRITIGINVRNRDVESFVNEVNEKLSAQLVLPAGYYVTYGGQFENLKDAQRTSSIAVPIALVTILVLLYFAFYSLRQSLMIFSAIPLAAVGGIWALYLRGMPFSISAGVGFIALFGVAVLNGIVLISYYNQLKNEGEDDVIKRVLKGTKLRLRPVMMTASVAALGFFPMALSSAPGAEVQKPLATVVIGGLVTSTFLTLVILPVIYVMFNGGFKMRKSNKVTAAIFVLLMSIPALQLNAQEKALTLDEAIAIATENNMEIRNASLDIEAAQKLKKSGFDLSPLEFEYDHGQLNSDLQDHYWSIRQPFSFPTVYTSQARFYKEVEKLNESRYLLVRQQLIRNVKSAYCTWSILYKKYGILKEKDSIYAGFNNATSVQFETGDIDQLAFVLAGSEATQVKSQLTEMETELAMAKQNLLQLMGVSFDISPAAQLQKFEITSMPGDKPSDTSNVRTRYITQMTEVQRSSLNREKMNHLPDFFVGYFNQSIDRVNGFEGFQVGASLPLWFWSNSGKVQASRIEVAKTENALDFEKQNLIREFQKQMAAYEGYRASLEYYENGGLEQIDQLIRNLQTSYRAGEINYFEFVRNIGLAFDVRLRYLDTLLKYNQSVIELEYLSAQ
ncbi:MAG TPA: CusA/CzcA family heavy metal efflux RND transporter [Bacteroidales bacterium]|nr:CusA/CzcA family heavy metal efflux RND transporter [Bacteroidales bacterium]